jgi:PKD repeat protein
MPTATAVAAASGITLDQMSSTMDDATPDGQSGTHVGKGFQPTNPHPGDAIVATFFWRGSSNTITTVTDHLCDVDATPVGNSYALVDYVTAGGYSMATYVATDVQGFSDTATTSDGLLCVHALFSDWVPEVGVILSAYQGVNAVSSQALGAHVSAFGTASSETMAGPGSIPVGAGAMAYAVAMANPPAGSDPPAGFIEITDISDNVMKSDADYRVASAAETDNPQWVWGFDQPGTWLATVVALNPATASNQPPTAAFTASCSAPTCTFASTSSDPDGSIASSSWTFGDGATSTAQNPSHTYGAGGTYTVTLGVTDNQGDSDAVSHTVTVTASNQPPTAAFTSSCNGLTCGFTSTSSDPDGSIASSSWTFGDGATSTVESPSHTYAAGGSYTVTLTVTDNQGATSTTSQSVTVAAPNQPPTAAFTSSCDGLTCGFTSTSSDPDGSIASYSWTFGDGSTSTAANPSRTYGAGGTYTVELTVTDNQGATNSVSNVVTVTPPNTAPVVSAGPNQTVVVGLLYTLNASFSDPDDGPWTYTINWGDGTSSSGTRATGGSLDVGHTYVVPLRTNNVTVTVTDSDGASGSASKTVTVIL